MANEISVNDDELEALMAELEEQNASMMAEVATTPATKQVDQPSAPIAEPEPAAPAVETKPAEREPVVERTRRIWIHHPESCCVFEGTEDDLKVGECVEVTEAQATKLNNYYQSKKAAAAPAAEAKPAAVEAKPAPVVVEKATAEAVSAAAPQDSPATDEIVEGEPRRPTADTGAGGLRFYIDVDAFRSDTRVTEANLDQCMIEQNGLRAYYGAQAANAEAQAARLKARFEVVEATLYDEHRKTLAAAGEKTTEKMVENAVKIDKRWLKAKNMVIEAETIAAINKGLVESIKDRRDMIIQLGADRRDEYKGAARVLAEQHEREALRERSLSAAQGAMGSRKAA